MVVRRETARIDGGGKRPTCSPQVLDSVESRAVAVAAAEAAAEAAAFNNTGKELAMAMAGSGTASPRAPRPASLSTESPIKEDRGGGAGAGIARENVISPSKMKQRSRGKAGGTPRKSSRSSGKTREGRDDRESRAGRHGGGGRQQRSGPSSPSSSRHASSSSGSAPDAPPRPIENLARAAGSDKENRGQSQGESAASLARSAARGAAAALLPEKERNEGTEGVSPTELRRRKLMNNLRPPDASLADLLDVLVDFQGTSHLRRVNACGAIKTLTLHKPNQIQLARTRGVVSSLTTVLCAVSATEEERTRCINALMHLCVPEQNWRIVYLFPQTPEALARNMADKYPQIRYAACLAASFLAKKNRREVVKNRLLMYATARVLEVDKNGALSRMGGQDRRVFVGARLCVLKMLLHLSKNRDVSTALARTECITSALVGAADSMELAANILCVAILTNLTRHPDNAHHLVHKVPGLVACLVHHVGGDEDECAKCALYAIQNMSCTGSCRQELANAPELLSSVTRAAFRHDRTEQQLSALHALKNLSDDPFNLVTMTNTPGCTATLLALANNDAGKGGSPPSLEATPRASGKGGGTMGKDDEDEKQQQLSLSRGGSNAMAQYLACDTLATLSHWLLTLSATRKVKGGTDGAGGGVAGIDAGRRTFKQSTWDAWV
ncbi:hypothetical protein ACHAWF_007182 [Thalassiosira exigua]